MAKPKVDIEVHTRQTGQTGALAGLRDHLKGIAGSIPGVQMGLGAMASAATLVGAAIAGAAKAVKEFAAAEREVAKLDAALARTGNLTDEYREKLQAMAGELQRATSIADDEWLSVLTRLVQFGADPASIGMDAEAVKNLAGIVGDVTTATNLYTKALAGSFEGLKRYGIQAKTVAELQEEAKRGAGQLEAQAGSLSGRFQNLSNVLGDVAEGIGQQIAKSTRLGEILDFSAGGLEWWAEKLGDTVDQLDGLKNATQSAGTSAADYAKHLQLVAELTEKVTAATDEKTRAIRATQSAEDEVADAKLALDLAQVDEAERSGKLSSKQAISERYKLRSAAAQGKFTRAQAADQAVLQANEQAFADLLKARQDMAGKKAGLESQIKSGALAEDRARVAKGRIAELQDQRRFIESQGGGVAEKDAALADIDRQIAQAERLASAPSLDPQRAELGVVDQGLAKLDEQIATRRSGVARDNTEIAQRMATRAAVHGLDQQRAGVVANGQLGGVGAAAQNVGAAAAGLQQGLGGVAQMSQQMVNISQQMAQIIQQTNARLAQIEAQVKNSRNP